MQSLGYVVSLSPHVQNLHIPAVLLYDESRADIDTLQLLVQKRLSIVVGEGAVEFHRTSDRNTYISVEHLHRVVGYLAAQEHVLELHFSSHQLRVVQLLQEFERHGLGPNGTTTGIGNVHDFLRTLAHADSLLVGLSCGGELHYVHKEHAGVVLYVVIIVVLHDAGLDFEGVLERGNSDERLVKYMARSSLLLSVVGGYLLLIFLIMLRYPNFPGTSAVCIRASRHNGIRVHICVWYRVEFRAPPRTPSPAMRQMGDWRRWTDRNYFLPSAAGCRTVGRSALCFAWRAGGNGA